MRNSAQGTRTAETARDHLLGSLKPLYGDRAEALADEVVSRAGVPPPQRAAPPWSERDAWLITYPDQFQATGERPLAVLKRVFDTHLQPTLNGIHVLPCYPFTSDDGYSITDYHEIDAAVGTWSDVEALSRTSRVMLDAVVNHMSASSEWFTRFLSGDPAFVGFFRTADPSADLSATVRPRTSPLLTEFEGAAGPVWVWTTFSADQVDLDYRNPKVFLAIVEVLFRYARHGAEILRLDAVQFIGKEEGTTSINLPQAHQVVQALRAALDVAFPDVLIITESNVPHHENLAYLGGPDEREAQAIYQFALAPLVLHTMITGDASALRRWATELPVPRAGTTYLNFLASHDGVAVRPVEEILAPADLEALVRHTENAGGRINARTLPGGGTAPYELACAWFDLMAHGVSEELARARHLASHAIMLALQGIPAIYVHSLFGTGNDHELAARTGVARSLNRHKFTDVAELESRLADGTSRASSLLAAFERMSAWRRRSPSFDPSVGQTVLDAPPGVFAVQRGDEARVYVNVRRQAERLDTEGWVDAGGQEVEWLEPFQSVWLRR